MKRALKSEWEKKKVSSLKKNNAKDKKRKCKELKRDMIEMLSQEDTI